jgi:hypothetical protein
MPLRVQLGNWDKFVQRYRRDPSQWYLIPKAKTYDEESIKLLIRGLGLLHKWFCEPDQLSVDHRELLKNYLREGQSRLFVDEAFTLKWGDAAQVFFAAKLFEEGIVSREQQDPQLRKRFDDVIAGIAAGENYEAIKRRFGQQLLVESFSANARNIINIYQRFGFAWIEKDHLVSITSVGRGLIDNSGDYKPLLEDQLRKLQFYNPSYERMRSRYGHIRIFPFTFCLRLILGLEPHEITLEEFALFVAKARDMGDSDRCLAWINEFRRLDGGEQQELLQKLRKGQRRRARPLLIESLDTARKNINFLTLSGPWERRKIGDSDGIVLTDEGKAAKILAEDENLQFVDFDSKEAWFSYFGDVSRKYDVEAAIAYYAKTGKASKAEKLVRKARDSGRARTVLQQKLREKQIEDLFVRDNLELLELGLRLYREGQRTGQQFDTPDAGTIDLLTVAADKSFVVIEFKRDQTSDQAVGQVLRYMGWVRKHLSPAKAVRGYVVASDFDRLIRYSLIGMQHPEIPNRHGRDLIQLHRHGFDPARVGRVSIDELSG